MSGAGANSMLQTKQMTSLSLLSAQTSEVRGFRRHGVGGTNPAEPRGLRTLISTWSALHYLQQNTHAPPLHKWVYSSGKVVSANRLFISLYQANC